MDTLKDKPHQMNFELENAKSRSTEIWDLIAGEGDLHSAVVEWDVTYNKTIQSFDFITDIFHKTG